MAGAIELNPATRQARRAWLILIIAFFGFLILAGSVAFMGRWIYQHATAPQQARLVIVRGTGLLVQSPDQPTWTLASDGAVVHEGDVISTALGTVATLELFDGSKIEISDDSEIQVERMRRSRFLDRTRANRIELRRGLIYVSMAGSGDAEISEVSVDTGHWRARMSEQQAQTEAGSFLVEIIQPASSEPALQPEIRIGVMRGTVVAEDSAGNTVIHGNQQVQCSTTNGCGEPSSIVRELVVNGDFAAGMQAWTPFDAGGPMEQANAGGAGITMSRDRTATGDHDIVVLRRADDQRLTGTLGVRQRIDKSLLLHTSLMLQIEARATVVEPGVDQRQPEDYALVVQLEYIDVNGQEQRWSQPFSTNIVTGQSRSGVTPLQRDQWQRLMFDLGSLSPVPQQISSIVVYASGATFETRVANISLTTSERAPD